MTVKESVDMQGLASTAGVSERVGHRAPRCADRCPASRRRCSDIWKNQRLHLAGRFSGRQSGLRADQQPVGFTPEPQAEVPADQRHLPRD